MTDSNTLVQLAETECLPCSKLSSPIALADRASLLESLKGWAIVRQDDVDRLVKVYRWPDFEASMAFAHRVGELAEQANHHPELTVAWGSTQVAWWTHVISGLHQNDFIMAARCELATEES